MAKRKNNLLFTLLLIFVFALSSCTKNKEDKSVDKKIKKDVKVQKKEAKPKKFKAVQTEGAFLILPIEGFKTMGDKSAKIVIMEFTDFECPFCRKFHSETLPLIQAEYIDTGKVRWITRAFPLPFHLAALPAAKSLYCVGKFGTDKQYWDFYNKLFLSDKINPSTPFEIAEQIGLNREKIAQCVSSSSAQDFIKKENSNATIYGVAGTPTFFIGIDNGAGSIKAVKLVGAQPIGKFREKIDSLLKSSK